MHLIILDLKCLILIELTILGLGIYNYRLLAITTYSLLAAAAEMFTIGVVTTASQCDLDLDVEKKGLISSIPILGMFLGILLLAHSLLSVVMLFRYSGEISDPFS